MKIEVVDPEYAYAFLNNVHNLGNDESESWKGTGDEEIDRVRRSGHFRFGYAELPMPLNNLGVITQRADNYFSALSFLTARAEGVFDGVSEVFRERMKNHHSFMPTTPNGTGYVLNPELGVAAVITDSHQGTAREICIGKGGAIPRAFGKREDFIIDIKELEGLANLFLNSCIDHLVTREKMAKPADLTFYLSLTP